jgi:transposase
MKSNIEPMKKTARTLSNFKEGIVNTIIYKITNGIAEGINSKIQKLNQIANGYRNYNNLRTAILFFNGKLNLFSQS